MKDLENSIGILTFWDVPNYGTFAQAYALQKVCEKICDKTEVLQIAYLDKKHYDFYYSSFPPYSVLTKSFWRELPQRLYPYSKYNRKKKIFHESYEKIPHTKYLTKDEMMNLKLSKLVLGSDIVWDYSFKVFNHDPFLFGNYIKAGKKLSYAASFGVVSENSNYPNYVINGIKQLDYISVRDIKSKKIADSISQKSADIVLDPTWLWDFNNDNNVIKPKFENYLVVYGQLFTEEFIQEIVRYARTRNLKIICLDCNNDKYTWCDLIIRQYQLSPYEWFGMFKYAEVIATSTFHGLTFGLIFNKKLAFCKSNFILAKAGDFLKDIGLYDVYTSYSPKQIFEYIENDLNYEEINKLINFKRKESLCFLKKALEE